MEKDFDRWNTKKKNIDARANIPFFNEREVWWCTLGLNIGSEQDGGKLYERPVLVVKKFNHDTFWALPLTTTGRRDKYLFRIPDNISSINLSQLRLVSSKRLAGLMYKIPNEQFREIIHQVKGLFPEV